MSLFSSTAAAALLAEVEKIPSAARAFTKSEVAKLETKFESRFADLEAKAEAKVEADLGAEFDAKVSAALAKLEGDGLDLSSLKSAIGGMTGEDMGEADDEGGSDADKSEPPASSSDKPTTVEESKKADVSTLAAATSLGFADFSHAVDGASPAAVGAGDASTTTIGTAGSQDPAASEPKPAEAPQKVDPATAGKQAADAASQVGDDPVPAAAKAAHAAAVELGVEPVKAATDAAAAAGAGPVEAARAADNAAAAVAQGQAPATA